MHDLATLRAGGYRAAGLAKLKITEALDAFPAEILDLGDTLEILDLSGTGLSAFPADFNGARLPKLRIAFFSNCRFRRFPCQALASCPRLEMVAFRRNGMGGWGVEGQNGKDEDEDNVVLPPQLRWLILTDNRLTRLPASIGACARLEKCMLAGNQLTGLPEAMAACRNLTLLRLAANRLEALPAWLLEMPKLAFLSFAGNPCSGAKTALSETSVAMSSGLPHVDWSQIEIHHVLGEGASGVISKGTIRGSTNGSVNGSAMNSRGASGVSTPALTSGIATPALSMVSTAASTLSMLSTVATEPPTPAPVAVKVFRGALTSDGTPYDEMAACMAAGQHVNLVQVHGQVRWEEDENETEAETEAVTGAEQDDKKAFRGGLIMALIPPQYRVLGQPPSFESCTRDCFPQAAAEAPAGCLSDAAGLAILLGVAAAAAHLHERGIAHGDLYAHNILVAGGGHKTEDGNANNKDTHAILSDFGAATLYGNGGDDDTSSSSQLEKLEVLAFAHLVEDVLGLMGVSSSSLSSSAISSTLRRLHAQCAVPTVAARPTFATLVGELSTLQK